MKSFFSRYENTLLLVLVLVFSSILLANNSKGEKEPNILEKVALTVASPIQSVVTKSIANTLSAWNYYIFLVNTAKENRVLKSSIADEKLKSMLLLEELKRYRRVESMVSFHPVAMSKFKVADVIGWDSTNISRTLVINKGSEDGIKKNMIVLTNEGLVGRIVNTSSNSSRILMISDARSAVDAYVQSSRDRCMIVGQNKERMIIKYLSIDSDVKVGDTIISAGFGGIFPKGLPLGTIYSTEPDDGRLFLKAELVPSANFRRIEEVLIMIGPKTKDNSTKVK